MAVTRFTIKIAGQPRSLFSITERGDEVTVGLKSPFYVDRTGTANHPKETPNIERSAIREHRFSIHPSPESPKGISAIKMTRILANGRKDYSRHYTRAIKSGGRFALIYTRRCGLLTLPDFAPKGKFTNVSLGTYDPSRFTLIYSIVIAARGLAFELSPNLQIQSLNILETDFKNLRIIVLWTFLGAPTMPYFFSATSLTVKGIESMMEGETADQCRIEFAKHCTEFTATLWQDAKIPDHIKNKLLFSRFGLSDEEVASLRFLETMRPILSLRLFEIGGKERRLSLSPYDLP